MTAKKQRPRQLPPDGPLPTVCPDCGSLMMVNAPCDVRRADGAWVQEEVVCTNEQRQRGSLARVCGLRWTRMTRRI